MATTKNASGRRPRQEAAGAQDAAEEDGCEASPARKSTPAAAKKSAAKRNRGARARRDEDRGRQAESRAASGSKREAAAAPRAATARRVAAPPPVDTSLFPCGDAALRAATGKDWSEWLALLDAAGAAATVARSSAHVGSGMQSLPDSAGWWGQMVAVGYERARGLREKHESCTGEFQATLSKTLPVPLFAAFAAWADEACARTGSMRRDSISPSSTWARTSARAGRTAAGSTSASTRAGPTSARSSSTR